MTDVRFVNELAATQASGGIVLRVCRETGMLDTHESETALDGQQNFDHIILNTGSLEYLLHEVKQFSKKVGIKLK